MLRAVRRDADLRLACVVVRWPFGFQYRFFMEADCFDMPRRARGRDWEMAQRGANMVLAKGA